MATATARVVDFISINNELKLTNINGNFVSSQPIIGSKTNANYLFNSYKIVTENLSTVTVTASAFNEDLTLETSTEDLTLETSTEDMLTESGNISSYTYSTSITEIKT